jgi:hypothetical protein
MMAALQVGRLKKNTHSKHRLGALLPCTEPLGPEISTYGPHPFGHSTHSPISLARTSACRTQFASDFLLLSVLLCVPWPTVAGFQCIMAANYGVGVSDGMSSAATCDPRRARWLAQRGAVSSSRHLSRTVPLTDASLEISRLSLGREKESETLKSSELNNQGVVVIDITQRFAEAARCVYSRCRASRCGGGM